jgi:shikimate dehydrogenase
VKCAVWGSPIAHSLSPVLHRAAYAALGLVDWTYDRREVDVDGFPHALAGLDESWRGLSLTMPLKEVALRSADRVAPVAAATGAVNTLVREAEGWAGHNTDVHGIAAALREVGCDSPSSALVIGSGATARSAVAALALMGVRRVAFMVRGQPRRATLAQAEAAGLAWESTSLGRWPDADVVVSTVPPAAVSGLDAFPAPATGRGSGALLDVVYGEGRTALEEAAARQGWAVQNGTAMLLHQATEQVRLMTGLAAPTEAMRAALAAALAVRRRTVSSDSPDLT